MNGERLTLKKGKSIYANLKKVSLISVLIFGIIGEHHVNSDNYKTVQKD